MRSDRSALALLLGCALLAGCGNGQPSELSVAQTMQKLHDADEAFERKDYNGALPLLTEAIAGPGLHADMLGDAYRKRAVCHLELGDLDQAGKDLEKAEEGGAVGASYYETLGRLALKQGDKSRAKEAYAQAIAADPNTSVPSELR
jgi:tetratricopeptide (TPR) repeat protein